MLLNAARPIIGKLSLTIATDIILNLMEEHATLATKCFAHGTFHVLHTASHVGIKVNWLTNQTAA